jgi:hypothetical protein
VCESATALWDRGVGAQRRKENARMIVSRVPRVGAIPRAGPSAAG